MSSHPRGERTAVRGWMPSIFCIWKQETRTVGTGCWVSASWQLSRPRQTEESPPSTICWLSEIVSRTEECRGQRRRTASSAMPTAGFRSLLHQLWFSATASRSAYRKYEQGCMMHISKNITVSQRAKSVTHTFIPSRSQGNKLRLKRCTHCWKITHSM